jgi:copper chaperone
MQLMEHEMDVTLMVSGMTCAACARSVKSVLESIKGVQSAQVSLENKQAQVSFDPARVDVAALSAAIEEAGYEVK